MKLLLTANVVFWLAVWAGGVAADQNLPPGWPWRGVNIDGVDFEVAALKDVVDKIRINSVLLRLRPRRLAGINNISSKKAWEESLLWADKMLDACKKQGLVAVVSVEGFPIDPDVDFNQTSPLFWVDAEEKRKVIDMASEISKRYAERGMELGAYRMLSEPVMRIGGQNFSPPGWRAFYVELIEAIRKNDPERWVAVSPAPWGLPSSYNKLERLPFQKIIYSAHVYEPHAFTHQGINDYLQDYSYPGVIEGNLWNKEKLVGAISNLREFQIKQQVPVWVGEFSVVRWARGGEQYLLDLIGIFEEYEWSWTYFSVNGWHGWNPDYSNDDPSNGGWRRQKIGDNSARWGTLKKVFNERLLAPDSAIQ